MAQFSFEIYSIGARGAKLRTEVPEAACLSSCASAARIKNIVDDGNNVLSRKARHAVRFQKNIHMAQKILCIVICN